LRNQQCLSSSSKEQRAQSPEEFILILFDTKAARLLESVLQIFIQSKCSKLDEEAKLVWNMQSIIMLRLDEARIVREST